MLGIFATNVLFQQQRGPVCLTTTESITGLRFLPAATARRWRRRRGAVDHATSPSRPIPPFPSRTNATNASTRRPTSQRCASTLRCSMRVRCTGASTAPMFQNIQWHSKSMLRLSTRTSGLSATTVIFAVRGQTCTAT